MTAFAISSESLFTAVAESIGLIVMVWEVEQGQIHFSDQWAVLTGSSPGLTSMSSEQFGTAIHPADRAGLDAAILRALKGSDQFYDAEIRVWCLRGEWQWLAVRGRVVVRNDAGRATRLVATFTDASERKQAEQVLADSEERYRMLYNTSLHGMLLTTSDGAVVSANPAACRMTGYSEAELIAVGYPELLDARDARLPTLLQARSTESITQGAIAMVRKDGSKIEVELSSVPFSDHSGVQRNSVVMQDVTPARTVERRLLRLTRLHEARSRCSRSAIQIKSRHALFDAVCTIVGESGDFGLAWVGLINQHSLDVSAATGRGRDSGYLDAAAVSIDPNLPIGRGPFGVAMREQRVAVSNDFLNDPDALPWRDAAALHGFRAVAVFPLSEGGEGIGALVLYATEVDYFDNHVVTLLTEIADDLSSGLDHLQREVALASSEARFRTLWEISNDAILMITQESIIRHANPAVHTLFGHPSNQLVGQPLAVLQPERLRQAHADSLSNFVRSGERRINWRGANMPGLHRDGHEIPLEISFSEANVEGERLFIGNMRDITERVRAQDLIKSQNRILKLIGAGAELDQTLMSICRLIHTQLSDLRCAIQPLPGAKDVLGWQVSSNLPEDFLRATAVRYDHAIHLAGGATAVAVLR